MENKKGDGIGWFLVAVIVAVGILVLVVLIYSILGKDLFGIASRIKNFFRLGIG